MIHNNPVQLQVRQAAQILGGNITNCHHALEELRRLSLILFSQTRAQETDIRRWFAAEGFGIDEDGFWTSLPLLAAYRNDRAPANAVSWSWHPDLVHNPDACFRMYCLRDAGTYLAEIRARLPDAAWIYYQDVTNTAIQFPYIDQITAITPDFDWSSYHTYVSVAPENNPEREIRWTSPTIDYAGEGLILSASVPVYFLNRFIGLWSIDLPMESLYKKSIFDTTMKGQVNFIIDRSGHLVAHPWVETKIDKEKGSLYQGHIRNLDKKFARLDIPALYREKTGHKLLARESDNETVVWFEVIPGIEWIFIASVPSRSMEDAVNLRIRKALDQVRSGDFSYRIKEVEDIDRAGHIAEGFNRMVEALEEQERIREENRKEKKKLETRLSHFQRMEAIGTLAGGIAHDFNNILFPILGYTELLLGDLPEDSKEHEMVSSIYRAAGRARDLTRQILTFSRQTEIKNQVVSFQSIAKEALKLLRASIPTSIEIINKIRNDCPAVYGDPTKLHQIIMNLCTNAFHAVETSGGRFEVCLEPITVGTEEMPGLDSLSPGTYIRLTVSDNGHGMDEATTMQIFDPYFTTKEEGKGTGLGLSVTYGIVTKLKGAMKVYSEPGKGSVFHVYLPAADLPAARHEETETEQKGGTERILLVDDETSITVMVKQFLERYGYSITAFTDSRDALAAFTQAPDEFDLVITDMSMPEMSGDLLAVKLKEIRPDISIILTTGFSEKISDKTYDTNAIDRFFMKPVAVGDLNRAIRSLMDTDDTDID
ncbi:MAG TPA: hypothetical protein DHV36_19235 [Desulfobacteraceae bacterium]|nr:hypothetical protein [Desulfobacteraceae bacterium]